MQLSTVELPASVAMGFALLLEAAFFCVAVLLVYEFVFKMMKFVSKTMIFAFKI